MVIWPTPDSFKNITISMTSIQQSTEMWQICELVIGPTPDTFKNLINLIKSNHQSTSILQICELVIGPTPDSFKNITNSMTSIQQSTEMWQICELVIGPTQDTFKFAARKLRIDNVTVLKFGMIPVHKYLTLKFTGNCHWIKSVCKNITNLM